MNFTAEQTNALKAKGKVLVSAAAGSGKTAVLVERVVNMLIDEQNGCDADSLLIVTFTNAAASEMRERIQQRLAKEIRKNPFNLHLKKQQMKLASAKITTIDSFCINLARDYFYALDISPDFNIADEGKISQRNESALAKTLNEYYKNASDEFLLLNRLIGQDDKNDALKSFVYKIYDHLMSIPNERLYIKNACKMYSEFDCESSEWTLMLNRHYSYSVNSIKEAFSRMNMWLGKTSDTVLIEKYTDEMNRTNSSLSALGTALDAGFEQTYDLLNLYEKFYFGITKFATDLDLYEGIRTAAKTANNLCKQMMNIYCAPSEQIKEDIRNNAPAVECLLKIVCDFKTLGDKMKKEQNCYGFGDVEKMVLNLLTKENNGNFELTDIAKNCSAGLFEVLVDEYQDTNDLQNTILNALSDNGKRLFMVGDVKQCIYRFRKANPSNFLRYRNTLPDFVEGKNQPESKVVMSGNFRSSSQVCDFINFMFSRLFSKRAGEMEYKEEDSLICKSEFLQIKMPRVITHLVDYNPENFKSMYEAEAAHVADFIRKTVDSGKEIITDGGKRRAANYGDFAILMRSRANMNEFVSMLSNAGIPTWEDNSEGLCEQSEIRLMINLLSVIDNPTRDIPLLSVMMSSLGGFSAEDVAQIRAENKKTSLYGSLLIASKQNEKAECFLKMLNGYRETAVSLDVASLIRNIYDKSGLINLSRLYNDAAVRIANLQRLADFAAEFEAGGQRGLYAFVRYLEHMTNDNSIKQFKTASESSNAVQLMTIHRSKGLQFPICIIAAAAKETGKNKTSPLIISDNNSIAFKTYTDNNVSYNNIAFSALQIEEERSNLAEELRILYVAATRAKDMLVVTAAQKNAGSYYNRIFNELTVSNNQITPAYVQSCKSFAQMVFAASFLYQSNSNQIDNKLINADEVPQFSAKQENCEQQACKANEQMLNELKNRLSFSYEFSEIYKTAAKQTASALAEKQNAEFYACSAVPLFLQNKKMSASEKGTAAHLFMQIADFSAAEKNVENEIERLEQNSMLTHEQAKSLNREYIEGFFKTDLYNRMKNAENIYKEYRFMVELSPCELDEKLDKRFASEQIVVQGVIDCLFEENGELVVVDYKTDRVNELSELVQSYEKQLFVYKLAAEKVFGKKVKQSFLYSLPKIKEVIC